MLCSTGHAERTFQFPGQPLRPLGEPWTFHFRAKSENPLLDCTVCVNATLFLLLILPFFDLNLRHESSYQYSIVHVPESPCSALAHTLII